MVDMDVRITCGPYGNDLGQHLSQIQDRMDWMERRICELENTISRVKEIVPLVDDNLGMHQSPEMNGESYGS